MTSVKPASNQDAQRIDKWLWAARFFKTRGLAVEAVSGGKVHLNDARVKPSKPVKVGDELTILRGLDHFTVRVMQLNDKRRPAKEAVLMYEESEESIAARAKASETRRYLHQNTPAEGKPNKKQRRQITRFIRNQ